MDALNATTLLRRMVAGDSAAGGRLMPLVYDELRALAAHFLQRQRPDHTLQPTALVHEAYLRIAGADQSPSQAAHFKAIAAQAMRQILINHARDRKAAKRGGGALRRVTLDEVLAEVESQAVDVVALDEALARLAALNSRQARLVELRVFGGLTIAEAARFLDVGLTTVKSDWAIARIWLKRELCGADA